MKKSKIAGSILSVLGICIVAFSGSIIDPKLENDVGPRLFPYIAGIGLIICGVGVFLRVGEEKEKAYLSKEGWLRLLRMSVLMLAYALGLLSLGYLMATPIMLFISIKIMGKSVISPVKTAAISLGMTFLVYIVFERVLHVLLPPGIVI